jgi:hypothetical protein
VGGLGIKVEADNSVEWSNWVTVEERKRTLYAVHFLSSLLVAAHNQDPKLVNNEIAWTCPAAKIFGLPKLHRNGVAKVA